MLAQRGRGALHPRWSSAHAHGRYPAVADVTCKAKTNLRNTWLAVEAAYQQALIGQNLATLSQLQANFAPLLFQKK